MKLYKFNTGIVFLTHHCISEPFGRERFSNTWSPLQNQVLFISKQRLKHVETFFGHIHLPQKVFL
ncbi:hypothetical protein SDC9_117521 [bioreactor metagenome]|uniref:Uncharacterized protein n=1 Tax=bioreactor metagenome TaxID=1076179 RepID=A0A645BYF9_9ZZZZ